jgi:hypothetical protein
MVAANEAENNGERWGILGNAPCGSRRSVAAGKKLFCEDHLSSAHVVPLLTLCALRVLAPAHAGSIVSDSKTQMEF